MDSLANPFILRALSSSNLTVQPYFQFLDRQTLPKPGSHPANSPVILFVNAMLIFASHRLRNRIMRTPEAARAMTMMAPALMADFQQQHPPRFRLANPGR